MSKRVDYCKRLLKKAFIIESNLGPNERENVSAFIDEMGEHYDDGKFLVNDKDACKCTKRNDVILMNDKNYCCDCFCIIKENRIKYVCKQCFSEYTEKPLVCDTCNNDKFSKEKEKK